MPNVAVRALAGMVDAVPVRVVQIGAAGHRVTAVPSVAATSSTRSERFRQPNCSRFTVKVIVAAGHILDHRPAADAERGNKTLWAVSASVMVPVAVLSVPIVTPSGSRLLVPSLKWSPFQGLIPLRQVIVCPV